MNPQEESESLIDSMFKQHEKQTCTLIRNHQQEVEALIAEKKQMQKHYEKKLLQMSNSLSQLDSYYLKKQRQGQIQSKQLQKRIYQLLETQQKLQSEKQNEKQLNKMLKILAKEQAQKLQEMKATNQQLESIAYGVYLSDVVVKIEKQQSQDNGNCKICYATPASMAFVECGHLCVCEQCAKNIPNGKCPLCKKISRKQKIYCSLLKKPE